MSCQTIHADVVSYGDHPPRYYKNHCAHCGTRLSGRFCTSCGARITRYSPLLNWITAAFGVHNSTVFHTLDLYDVRLTIAFTFSSTLSDVVLSLMDRGYQKERVAMALMQEEIAHGK